MKHTSNFFSRLSVRGIGSLRLRFSFLVLLACCTSATAQTTAFTYQGQLADNGNPANGHHDFQFKLFDGAGSQHGTTQTVTDFTVTNGFSAVSLDFVNCSGCSCPTCFDGSPRFLEIAVKPTSGPTYAMLSPRQPVTATPYAIRSLNASQLDGQPASGFIQNTTSQQATTNFNISGDGTLGGTLNAGIVNAGTQYNIVSPAGVGSVRIMGISGVGDTNTFGRFGTFSIDSVGATSGRFSVLENGNVGIGVPNPAQKLTISGAGITRALVNSDSNAGIGLGLNNQQKWSVATVTGGNFQIFNDALGQNALWIDSTDNNVGIGVTSPGARLQVLGDTNGLVVDNNNTGGLIASFGSKGAFKIDSSTLPGGRFFIPEDGKVRINNPPDPPNLITETSEKLVVIGVVRIGLGLVGVIPICLNTNQQVAGCVSSIRYKENVNNFSPGFDLIRRLRPVSFNWKQNGMTDIGLIAEEVAKEDPLQATYDNNGAIQGVKYDRVGVVLINAVKEQQAQIERQEKLIQAQHRQIEALNKLVCAANPTAALCVDTHAALQRRLESSHRKSHIGKK